MKKLSLVVAFLGFANILSVSAQTIRGTVIDYDSKQPIPYSTVAVMGSTKGDVTDENGNFEITGLKVGRYDVEASYLGYESQRMAQVLVVSGKDIGLVFELKASAQEIGEVVVAPKLRRDETINKMGGITGRSLIADDAKILAGSIGDPARLASNFAGVTVGNLQENGLIIRGNSPKGVLWRVEGVEVYNPNHIAGGNMAGGGFVNIFGCNLLGNSDFYTGAFPAEYGNSTSGVFDINFRNGNTSRREYFAQLGILGIEVGAEGYFKKESSASYNVGARVSSLGTIGRLSGGEAPDYMDLSMKLNFPANKLGTFTFWGMGGLSKNHKPIYEYQEKWDEGVLEKFKYPKYESDWQDYNMDWKVGALALSHRISLGNGTYLKTDLAASSMAYGFRSKWYDEIDDQYYDCEDNYQSEGKYTFQTMLNHRLDGKSTVRAGIVYDFLMSDYRVDMASEPKQEMESKVRSTENTWYLQAFAQASYLPVRWLTLNAGMHYSHFGLTGETCIEPRASVVADFGKGHTFGFSLGEHTQREELKIYFSPNVTSEYSNMNLKLQKSMHYVLTYNWLISENLRFKIEPYYQKLWNVPIDATGGYFSMINYKKEWLIERDLVSKGTARNVGVDLTMERFFNRGWYFMITGSIFDSRYIDGDGIERHSLYSRNFVANLMIGKEFIFGSREGRERVFGTNLKTSFMGGEYSSPIMVEESLEAEEVVYDYSKAYSVKNSPSLFVDVSFYLKRNHKNYTTSWILEMKNATLQKVFNGYKYNFTSEQVDKYYQFFIMPQLAYRIEF